MGRMKRKTRALRERVTGGNSEWESARDSNGTYGLRVRCHQPELHAPSWWAVQGLRTCDQWIKKSTHFYQLS